MESGAYALALCSGQILCVQVWGGEEGTKEATSAAAADGAARVVRPAELTAFKAAMPFFDFGDDACTR
eukprot:5068126-Pyramimonas_sp.AAC.1